MRQRKRHMRRRERRISTSPSWIMSHTEPPVIPIELDSEDEEIDAEVQRRGEASRRRGEGAGPSGSQPMEMGELSQDD